jgi:hypothetical protein
MFETLLSNIVEPEFAKTVKNHIETLLAVDFDPQFAHPHDVSIAVYMLAIIESNPKLVETLLTDGPPVQGLFWARIAAKSLQNKLQEPEIHAVDD